MSKCYVSELVLAAELSFCFDVTFVVFDFVFLPWRNFAFRFSSFFSLCSPLPPPPQVTSTFIFRPARTLWCRLRAFCKVTRTNNFTI